ncbi:GL22429 [Drosophila persimilis]|uniref:GL22429 n=1 Tax=Drosophila persimilis TaxID=7234 RepID=B4H1P1_DROPE|nr:GL22429 [Drosophila persimilis]
MISITKRNGKALFQYAAPGTRYNDDTTLTNQLKASSVKEQLKFRAEQKQRRGCGCLATNQPIYEVQAGERESSSNDESKRKQQQQQQQQQRAENSKNEWQCAVVEAGYYNNAVCSKEKKEKEEEEAQSETLRTPAEGSAALMLLLPPLLLFPLRCVVYKNLTSAPFMISENSKLVQERQPGSSNNSNNSSSNSEGCNGTNINM